MRQRPQRRPDDERVTEVDNQKKAIKNAVGAIISFAVGGCCYGGVSLFYNYITDSMGVGATEFSVMFTCISIGLMVSGLYAGTMINRFNPKRVGMLGMLGPLLLYLSISLGGNLFFMYAGALLFGLMMGFFSQVSLSIVLSRWIGAGRGTFMGIASGASSGAAMVFTILGAKLVETVGGRTAALLIAVVFGLIILACYLFLVSDFPEAYGMKPADFHSRKERKKTVTPLGEKETAFECKMPLARIVKTPVFWVIMGSTVISTMAYQFFYSNSMIIFQASGLEYMNASVCVSITSLAAMAASILLGSCCDSIGAKKTLMIFAGIAACAMLVAPRFSGWTCAILLAVFTSMGQFSNYVAFYTAPAIFGAEKSANIMSWGITACGIASAIAIPMCNVIADVSGGYQIPLMIAGIVFLACIPMFGYLGSDATAGKIRELDKEYEEENA